jgi:hypothetical protein
MTTREAAIAELEAGQAALDALMARLSYEHLEVARSIGGGDWSAKDLLGHIAGWEEIAVQTLDEWRDGTPPWIEEFFAMSDGVDQLNADNDLHGSSLSLDETRIRADDAHRRLLAEITAMSDEEWNTKAWYPTEKRKTLAALLGSILGGRQRPFGHVFDHLADLEAYVEEVASGRPPPP